MSASDLSESVLILIVGLVVALPLARAFRLPWGRVTILTLWHSAFSFVYAYLSLQTESDSTGYYNSALRGSYEWSLGTASVTNIAYPLVHYFGLSFLALNLVFGLFGLVGLLALDASLQHALRNQSTFKKAVWGTLIFLPSLSYWSSALGKDSIAFMATGLALWASIDFGRRLLAIALAVIAMTIVRPHMAAFMVAGVATALILSRSASVWKRVVFGALFVALAGTLIVFSLDYVGLDSVTVEDVGSYLQARQGYNMEGAGGIDIAGMSTPARVFTYLFRPLPGEAHNALSTAASAENGIVLVLVALSVWRLVRVRPGPGGSSRIFIWSYTIPALFVLASTTANLGISQRQKWMILPMFIYAVMSNFAPAASLSKVQVSRVLVTRPDEFKGTPIR